MVEYVFNGVAPALALLERRSSVGTPCARSDSSVFSRAGARAGSTNPRPTLLLVDERPRTSYGDSNGRARWGQYGLGEWPQHSRLSLTRYGGRRCIFAFRFVSSTS